MLALMRFSVEKVYEIIFSRKAAKFILSMPKKYREKIKNILENLRENPYAYPYKKIKGEVNVYRIRIGRYRLLYEVDKKNGRIIVLKIDKRERVYE